MSMYDRPRMPRAGDHLYSDYSLYDCEYSSTPVSYVVPVDAMEHAKDHLIGIYEKFSQNESAFFHLEEIFSALRIPLPE